MDTKEEREDCDQLDIAVADGQATSDLRALEDNSSDTGTKCGSHPRTVTTLSKIADELQSATPVISNVAVTNSENVHFGNNTYFNGPVVIKQIIQSNSGLDNVAYSKTEDENFHNNAQHATPIKCDTSITRGFHIKMWHKIVIILGSLVTMSVACSVALISSDTDATPNSIINTSTVSAIILFISYQLNRLRGVGRWKYPQYFNKGSAHIHTYNQEGTTENLIIAKFHLRWVTRTEWLAEPPTGALDPIVLPVPWVIIAHTATESCNTQSDCVLRTRLIQTFHIESRKWSDIGYNFLIGGDGSVYYGRGWDTVGAHTKGYNKYSMGVAFIGSFSTEEPSSQQLEACQKLLKLGVELGKLEKDYKLLAHRQLWATSSPGDKLFEIIKEWPHFVKNATGITDTLKT